MRLQSLQKKKQWNRRCDARARNMPLTSASKERRNLRLNLEERGGGSSEEDGNRGVDLLGTCWDNTSVAGGLAICDGGGAGAGAGACGIASSFADLGGCAVNQAGKVSKATKKATSRLDRDYDHEKSKGEVVELHVVVWK